MSSTSGYPVPPAPASPPGAPDTWPRRPEFLTDTTLCPGCFSDIAIAPLPTANDGSPGPVCTRCGLDLSVPEASALLEAGKAVVHAEFQRQGLVARMRSAQAEQERRVAQARAAAATPAPSYQPQAATPAPVFAQPAAASATHNQQYPPAPWASPGMPVQPPWPPASTGQHPAKPRRSGIQILMLTVGVILVSVMALFFVLLAYFIASLEIRSLLTGAASVAVFGAAVLLNRRRLQGTAEGIAALAVVLFLLDLWIIRANGVFGSGELDGWLYMGLSVGLLTTLLALGARTIPLRTLSMSAVILGPVALFALVQGLLADVDFATRLWTALAAVGFASLVWTRIPGRVERTLLRITGMVATAVAGVCAFGAFPDLPAGGSIAFAVLAAVWLCLLAAAPVAETGRADAAAPVRLDGWGALTAIGLGLAAAGAGLSLFLWGRVEDAVLWLPATVTAVSAFVVSSLTRIPGMGRLVPALRLAALIPLGLAGLASGPALALSLATCAWGATTMPFSVAAFGSPPDPLFSLSFEPPLALLLVAGIALATLATLRLAARLSWIPVGVGSLGLIAASASIGQPVTSALCLGLLAAASLAAIVVLPSGSLRIALGSAFAVAVFVFSTIGLTSTATFPVTALASLALLGAARQVLARTAAPSAGGLVPVATGLAAIALIFSARMVPAWFEAVTGTTAPTGSAALWMALTALLVCAVIPFAPGLLTRAELAVLGATAALAAGIGLVELVGLGSPVPLLSALIAAAVAGMAWQLNDRVADWPERFVAAAVTPVAILWAAEIAWTNFGPTGPSGTGQADTTGVVLGATVVLLAALGLVLFRRRGPGTSPARFAWDGALAIGAALVLVSVWVRPELGWLTLLLLAVSALLVGSGEGGIVSGTSPRRHLAWLGFPLAVAGLWLGLARADATVIELYTLPVAGLLLAILGITLARRPVRGARAEPGRSALLAAALVVGLVPSAIAATGAEPLRAGIVLGASALLIGVGTLAPPVFRGMWLSSVLWTAGVAGATIAGLGRALLNPDGDSIPFEIWSGSAALLLLGAGLLWYRTGDVPGVLAAVAVTASVVVLSVPTLAVLLTSGVEAWRGFLVLAVACGFVVAASVRDEFAPVLRWVSIACALVLAGALVATGTADPFELATVPVASALIVGGGIRLTRNGRRGSWTELGPGLLVLLLPSLLADFGVANELWRVVGLGVVALAVFGAGLALKLQAPTLLGAGVVVVHALAQLWPWISGLYGSVPWWLWAGIGGIVLIVLAATYESRIRDLKAAARGVSSLR
ncbi:hypothetical protein [Mycetocola sp. 2940]|uniref:SCO7613 C-terminal domain-containing membrane protein n=1 Tax=Mycetocola sp. 2940 TaxID=3156452 RepID=UPI0033994C0A